MRLIRKCAAWSLLLGAPLSAQAVLYGLRGQPGDGFGAAMVAPGDLDLDGFVDFAIGAPDRHGGSGAIDLFSARGGVRLWSVQGSTGEHLGRRIEPAFDLDRDGRPDLWALTDLGLQAHSGRDGALLWRYARPRQFTPLADYDADGHADVVLVEASGDLVVRSGRHGGVLTALPAPGLSVLALAAAGDVDRDGYPDVITTRGDASSLRLVDVWSLRRGVSLFATSHVGTGFGQQIGSVGDWDGDGHSDFFVFDAQVDDPPPTSDNGISLVYSGATFATLFRDVGYIYGYHATFWRILRHLGYTNPPVDVDGDLLPERFVRQELWGAPQVAVVGGDGTVVRLPGTSIVSAGDVDRDGLGDYLIARSGEVAVVSAGRTARRRHGLAGYPTALWNCARLGDLDRDGYEDYAYTTAWQNMPDRSLSTMVLCSGATGQPLWTYARSESVAMLDFRFAAGGDIDRNGAVDFAVASYGHNEVTVFGGLPNPAPILTITGVPAQSALALGADWNGDGVGDVFCGGSASIELRSGVDGALFATLTHGGQSLQLIGDLDGDAVADLLADDQIISSNTRSVVRTLPSLPCAFVGDENGDGRVDAWMTEAGDLVLVSGIDGRELRRVPGPLGGAVTALSAGADWNGDGWADLVAGQTTWNDCGRAVVLSGLNGQVLHEEWGERAGDLFGNAVGMLRFDRARFGQGALVSSARRGDLGDRGYARWAQARTTRAAVHAYGQACGYGDLQPRLRWTGGAPRLGATCGLHADGLRDQTPALLLLATRGDAFGNVALPLDLRGFGMPGCLLHVPAELIVPVLASSTGRASLPIAIPSEPAVVGARFFAQALVPAVAANQVGMLASDAVRIELGR